MKQIYLTALTNERYIPGVMALARSLHEVKSAYDLAIMIPKEKETALSNAIKEYGILNIPGTFILPKEKIQLSEMDTLVENKYSYWMDTFFKLQAASCTEYDKIILLDSDMLVVQNLDHLFDAPNFSAAICGKCVHEDWLDLNSGLLVLEPSSSLHEKLLSLIVPAIELKKSKGLQAGDQDVFHLVFPDWRYHPELCLPEKYSICWGWIGDLCKKENCLPEDFYVIHFTGKSKPWDFGKCYHIRIMFSHLLQRKLDQLVYKIRTWRKYRLLCERI